MSGIPKDFALGANEYGNVQIRCRLCAGGPQEISGMEDAMRFMTRHECPPPAMPGVIHSAELGACCIACSSPAEHFFTQHRRNA